MEINSKQAAEIGRNVVHYRREIDEGRPWLGDGALNEDTLQAVASGAANTYDLGGLVTQLDRADDSLDFLRNLLAVTFAHGFRTAAAFSSQGEAPADK